MARKIPHFPSFTISQLKVGEVPYVMEWVLVLGGGGRHGSWGSVPAVCIRFAIAGFVKGTPFVLPLQ